MVDKSSLALADDTRRSACTSYPVFKEPTSERIVRPLGSVYPEAHQTASPAVFRGTFQGYLHREKLSSPVTTCDHVMRVLLSFRPTRLNRQEGKAIEGPNLRGALGPNDYPTLPASVCQLSSPRRITIDCAQSERVRHRNKRPIVANRSWTVKQSQKRQRRAKAVRADPYWSS